MTLDEIDTIAVLGAGTMGHGIAEIAAMAGYDVHLRDIDEALVSDGLEEIEWSLDKLVEHEHLTQEEATAALERVTPIVPIEEAVGAVDFVIEAVPERMDIKREVFEAVSEAAPAQAVFATNTSSLPITEIAAATDRPERVCGMHFFNPPVRMNLVEVIAGEQTAEETLDLTERLAEDLDKTPVRVHKDSPGFIVNRVLIPLLNEAAWVVHEEIASRETVDATAKYELGLPMGAFELADQVGIDVIDDVLAFIHGELGPAYAPCPLIEQKVEAGELGKKTGTGFYAYENGGVSIPSDAGSAALAERLLAVMANEVAKLVAESVADVQAIDTAMELGAGFPEGPAKLADEHGLDRLVDRLEKLHEETGSERYAPAEGFRELATAGGFHDSPSSADEASFEDLRIEYPRDHVGAIVLDRPHRMNAISPGVLEELPRAVDRLEAEADIRAILLQGEGDRAFSVGADVPAMSAVWGDGIAATELSRTGQAAFGRLHESDLPVIAAVDGYCLGGGMELATAADLRIASERATFGQPERNLGLLPGWGGTQRLAPIVGLGRAKEIILGGEHYEAETMERFGFVNRVVSVSDFETEAADYAEEIASGPPIAQSLAKRAMNIGAADRAGGLEVEAEAFGHLTHTDDLMEGVSAFLEDRDPEFEGT